MGFIGYYDVSLYKKKNDIMVGSLDEYPNSINIIYRNSHYATENVLLDNVQFLNELFTWSCYKDITFKEKLGEISYQATYPDNGDSFVTEKSVQKMVVLGSNGIFSGIV